MKLQKIKHSNLKQLRYEQWLKQGRKCPILGQKIDFEDSVIDHCHITKKELKQGKIGEDGKGLLRGVLDFRSNAFEGKVANGFKRTGLQKLGVYLPDALRRLAEYLEKPLIKEKIIHPTENKKPKKLGKREYNLVKKYYFSIYPKRKKFPEWKKGMKLTKKWEQWIKKVKIYKEK